MTKPAAFPRDNFLHVAPGLGRVMTPRAFFRDKKTPAGTSSQRAFFGVLFGTGTGFRQIVVRHAVALMTGTSAM